jgi:quercetin dioxygenase-like cupin family protein
VKLVSFDATKAITRFDSQGATIGGVASCAGSVRISILELEAGGVVGMHQAACPQLFVVIDGSGWVRPGGGERQPLARGGAALWESGERHESSTEFGLRAIVVEAESIELL